MRYLLDTNIISYYLKNKYPNIAEHLKKIPFSSIQIPTIAIAEIEYGCRKCQDYGKTMSIYQQFFNCFEAIPFSETAAIAYGQIRAELETKGEIIGANDLLIAAIALAEDCILVTHNVKEFQKVAGLKIEDWTE